MNPDTIIVGGGIIGCSIALRLAQSGLKVTLIERGALGREASWAAAGMLTPQSETTGKEPLFEIGIRSRALYRDFTDELRDISGIDSEYRAEGTVCIALRDDDLREFAVCSRAQNALGLRAELVSAEEARRIEPSATPAALGGLFLPDDHQVENRKLMQSLAAALAKLDVGIVDNREVTQIATEGNRAIGVSCSGELFTAGSVIVATGCWSSRLLSTVGMNLEVVPARGQMLAVKGGLTMSRVLHSSKVYVVPRLDGRILIGATVEYAGYSRQVTAAAMNSLMTAAIELAPAIADCEVTEMWCGFRPDTPDHCPIMGPAPLENLFIATGHFRNGILLAPITADAIKEAVINGAMPAYMDRFNWQRFESKQPMNKSS